MPTLAPVDGIDIQVLVDNVTDSLSSVPAFVETEFASLSRRRRGTWVLRGACLCCAAHGLACLVTLRQHDRTRVLLFDSGPEDRTFEQNVSRLGVDLGLVEAIVLSHGHWDHGGAMLRALQLIRDRNGGREIPIYVHPDMFRTRASKQPNGTMRLMEDVPSIDALTNEGAMVVNTTEAQVLLDGMAFVSGQIPRVFASPTRLRGSANAPSSPGLDSPAKPVLRFQDARPAGPAPPPSVPPRVCSHPAVRGCRQWPAIGIGRLVGSGIVAQRARPNPAVPAAAPTTGDPDVHAPAETGRVTRVRVPERPEVLLGADTVVRRRRAERINAAHAPR